MYLEKSVMIVALEASTAGQLCAEQVILWPALPA